MGTRGAFAYGAIIMPWEKGKRRVFAYDEIIRTWEAGKRRVCLNMRAASGL